MTNTTSNPRHHRGGTWSRQPFDPAQPEGWARPYPITTHTIATAGDVAWSRVHFGLLDNASAAGVEVQRRPMGPFTGGGACVWTGDRGPVVAVDSRLREHRDIVEVLAHELGHAASGSRFGADEADVHRRRRLREQAADTIGRFLIEALQDDHTLLLLPLDTAARRDLLTVAAAAIGEEVTS